MSNSVSTKDLDKIEILMKLNELPLEKLQSIAEWVGIIPSEQNIPDNNN